MPDYKRLFYLSQAKIADMINHLDEMLADLKKFMLDCEEDVISEENDTKCIEIYSHDSFNDI